MRERQRELAQRQMVQRQAAAQRDGRVVAAFGLPTEMEPVYRRILPGNGQSLEQVATSMLLTPDELRDRLAPLLALQIVTVEDGILRVVDPATATSRVLARQAADLAVAGQELARIAEVLPGLAEVRDAHVPHDQLIDGDVSGMADVPALIAQWIREGRGDVCFLRPDQWRFPSESEMAVAVGNAIREGKRVRAIYPARAMSEAPQMLRTRAEIGEEVRVVPTVLTRLVIVGPRRAIVPEPLGVGSDRRAVVRQPAIVGMFQAYFDELWRGVTGDYDALVAAFEPHLSRKAADLSPIERAILVIGAWELKSRLDIPYRVVINEAVELAKSFGATDGHRFVNGVLDKTAADLRAAEIAALSR